MFVDKVDIHVASGKGGAGAVSFRREKYVIQGGPDGGDGGKGGNLYFEADTNTDTLSKFKGAKHFHAKNGQPGMGKRMSGKSGEDMIVIVPPGTQVFDYESGELLLDLQKGGERILFLEGGKGGLGNFHFKSSVNQRPTYAQEGIAGQERHVRLELKLIADVGLVGFPNVGKSTLISTLSNARPLVADYEFTTLIPALGVVNVDEFSSFVMADIPGIIDGASEGRGLGLEFLRHIERTKMLLFVIDLANHREPLEQLKILRSELERFSSELALRPFALALSRVDSLPVHEAGEKIARFLQALGVAPNESPKYPLTNGLPAYISSDTSWKNRESQPLRNQADKNQAHSNHAGEEQPCASKESPVFGARFILPISSVTHANIQPLIYLLYASLRGRA